MPSLLTTGSSTRMPRLSAAALTFCRSPVSPMKFLSKESSQVRSTFGVSTCGSVETKTTLIFACSSAGSFCIATAMSPIVVGQTSGQLV